MTLKLRNLVLRILVVTLSAGPVLADDAAAPLEGPRVTLHWNSSRDTSTVYEAAANGPLELLATITDVDTIMGFEIEIHVLRGKESQVWRFVAQEECPVAALDVDANGTREVPAPWRSKLLLSDAREMEAGRSRVMALAAFHQEAIDPEASYLLCRFRLTPPAAQDASCDGWDGGATFELARVVYLRGRGREIEVTRLGSPLVYRLASAD